MINVLYGDSIRSVNDKHDTKRDNSTEAYKIRGSSPSCAVVRTVPSSADG